MDRQQAAICDMVKYVGYLQEKKWVTSHDFVDHKLWMVVPHKHFGMFIYSENLETLKWYCINNDMMMNIHIEDYDSKYPLEWSQDPRIHITFAVEFSYDYYRNPSAPRTLSLMMDWIITKLERFVHWLTR